MAVKQPAQTAPVMVDPLQHLNATVHHMQDEKKKESQILCTLNSPGRAKDGKLVFHPGFTQKTSIIPIVQDNKIKEGFLMSPDETEITLKHGGYYYITFTTVAQRAELLIGRQCFASVRGPGNSSLTLNIFVIVSPKTPVSVGVMGAVESAPTDHWISIRYLSHS